MGCVGSSEGKGQLLDLQSHSQLLAVRLDAEIVPQQDGFLKTFMINAQLNRKNQKDMELVNAIDFTPLIEQFKSTYGKELENELENIKKNDIKTLEITIRSLYTQIIEDKMMSVNRKEISMKKCKVLIAEFMLSILIKTLKYTVEKYSIEYANALFTKLQQFSKILCTFLKTKYPRGQNIDAGKLGKEFKEFDCTDDFEHDIIAKAQVIFKTKNRNIDVNVKPVETKRKKKNSKQSSQKKSEATSNLNNDEQQSNDSDNQNEDKQQLQVQDFQIGKEDKDTSEVNEFEITNTIKIFLNRIMDEIDENYLNFCKIFQTQIHKDFKVSRKISQNTARCTLLDTGVIEINSIEVARVLVKWLENLEEFISKPQELLSSNYEVKVTKYSQYNKYSTLDEINKTRFKLKANPKATKYQQIQRQQLEKLLNQGELINLLKREYKKLIINEYQQKYEQYFKQFSSYAIKNLQEVVFDQRQISSNQTQIVKFSYQMSNLISWIVEQKLIAVIKSLTKVAQRFKLSHGVPNFIKFKVNDLMRCQIAGNQKTIKEVWNKICLKQKQNNGQIEIVKIKNRFHTENHDAVILFKMKNSFLICECQLILVDQKYTEDTRNSYIYEMNHFLYELQRSPFGIFGQLSIFLKTESHMVSSYYNNLKLRPKNRRLEEIKKCFKFKNLKQNASSSMIETGKSKLTLNSKFRSRPFVCSICLKYFHKFSNFSKTMFECQQYTVKVCESCQIQKIKQNKKIDKNNEDDQRTKSLSKVWDSIQKILIQKAQLNSSNYQETNLQKILPRFIFESLQLQNIMIDAQKLSKKLKAQIIEQHVRKEQNQNLKPPQKQLDINKKDLRKNRLKAENLMKYFEATQFQAIKKGWKIHFAIYSKIADIQKLVLYRYHSYEGVIQNVYSQVERYLKHQYIEINQSSQFFLLKNVWRTSVASMFNLKKQKKQQTVSKNSQPLQSVQEKAPEEEDETDEKKSNLENLSQILYQPIKLGLKEQNDEQNDPTSIQLFDFQPAKSANSEKTINKESFSSSDILNQKKESLKKTFQKCIQPFYYQAQYKISEKIQPQKHEFYYIEYVQKKDNKNFIYILLDADLEKENKENSDLLSILSSFSSLKNLKQKIDLSNLGITNDKICAVKAQYEKKKKNISKQNSKANQTPKQMPIPIQTSSLLVKALQKANKTSKQTPIPIETSSLLVKALQNQISNQQTAKLILNMFSNSTSSSEKSYQWIDKIKILDLSKNKLQIIKDLPSMFSRLESLDVSQNSILSLDITSSFKKLRELKAEDNQIRVIKSFQYYENLVVLNVSNNKISYFGAKSSNKIKQLYISSNFLEKFQNFHHFEVLQIFVADENFFGSFDGNLISSKLRILSLNNNKLKKVSNLHMLKKLQKIAFKGNQLKQFSIMQSLQKFESIDLSDNYELSSLQISNTKPLKQIYLDSIGLTDQKLSSMVLGDNEFERLQILSLRQNDLRKFPDLKQYLEEYLVQDDQSQKIGLTQLHLEKNPILFGLNIELDSQLEEEDEELHLLNSETIKNTDPTMQSEEPQKIIVQEMPVIYSESFDRFHKQFFYEKLTSKESKVENNEIYKQHKGKLSDNSNQEHHTDKTQMQQIEHKLKDGSISNNERQPQNTNQQGNNLINKSVNPASNQPVQENMQNANNGNTLSKTKEQPNPIIEDPNSQSNLIHVNSKAESENQQSQDSPQKYTNLKRKFKAISKEFQGLTQEEVKNHSRKFLQNDSKGEVEESHQKPPEVSQKAERKILDCFDEVQENQNNPHSQQLSQTEKEQPDVQQPILQQKEQQIFYDKDEEFQKYEPQGPAPNSDDFRVDNQIIGKEGKQKGKKVELSEDELFRKDINNIKWLLANNVSFQIPIQINLLKSKHNGYYELILSIIRQCDASKLRFNHFKNFDNHEKLQMQKKKEKRQKNFINLLYRQRPITKVNRFKSVLTSKENQKLSVSTKQTETVKYVYLKRLLNQNEINDRYYRDEDNPKMYHFYHPACNLNMNDFVLFDWTSLSRIYLLGCQIDDVKWKTFSDHAESKFPNLKTIYICQNNIKTVEMEQLQNFKVPCTNIWFYYESWFQNYTNRLSDASLKVIRRFNQNNRKKRWIISCKEDQNTFNSQYNSDQLGQES